MNEPAIVGCILTKNEAGNIERAVRSLQKVTSDVVVIDSASEDDTVELAKALDAHVLVHPFESFPAQRNWALDEIVDRFGDVWVLSIDADEWLSDELAAEIVASTPRLGADADVYQLKRRVRFDGRVLRYGGFRFSLLTRLVRATGPRYEPREVNEHFELPDGTRIGRFEGWLEHADVDSWERYIDKHNRYSTLEARARLRQGRGDRITLADARRNPALRRRFLRQRVWDRLPASAKPAIRFVQVYVIFGGFLDGSAGFRRALFEAWQEMCTDLKAERAALARTIASAGEDVTTSARAEGSTH